jgi:hypothetical protein
MRTRSIPPVRHLGVAKMKLVPSVPNSKPLPEPTRGILASVSSDFLRDVVARISVPRVHGTSENEAVRRMIVDLFSGTEAGRLGVEVDGAGNVVVGP